MHSMPVLHALSRRIDIPYVFEQYNNLICSRTDLKPGFSTPAEPEVS